MVDWGSIVGVIGIGYSVFQEIRRHEQRRAFGAYSQSMFNQLRRIGANAEGVPRKDDLAEAKQDATAINEHRQGLMNDVIAFSREYAGFIPFAEDPWQPKPLPTPWWRRRG
jgi:hypothetical protein